MNINGNIKDNVDTPENTRPFLGVNGDFVYEAEMTPENAGWVPVEVPCGS